MGVNYGWEKFYTALRYAAASNDSLQRRLENVMINLVPLQRFSFPSEEMWERFQSLKEETTKCEATFEGEGRIHATTSQTADEEAKRLLQESFDIFNGLANAEGAETASQLVA